MNRGVNETGQTEFLELARGNYFGSRLRLALPQCARRLTRGLPHLLPQFYVPVGEINKMFPTIMLVQAEMDLRKRTPLWPLGLADQMHSGLLRRAIGFESIAADARAHDI